MTIEIRPEEPRDFTAVRDVVARAFGGTGAGARTDDGAPAEASLVGWLRESASYDPRFALVADDGGECVGYVIASWGECDGVAVFGIGPLAVAPEHQGRGVGSALVRAVLAQAAEAGERVVVLLGEPAYYERFGFVPARELGIHADPAWGDFFQACVLDASAGAPERMPTGTYRYAEPFSRLR